MNHRKPLCALRVGQSAVIKEISPNCAIRQRLLDLGLIKDTRVRCLFKSPFGGMKAYRIRGATIAIRDKDCVDVVTEPYPEGSENNERDT